MTNRKRRSRALAASSAGALAVLSAGVLAAGCSGGSANPPVDAAQEPTGRRVMVETQTVESVPFTEYIRVVGDVEAERTVTVSAEEGGTIRELLVDKGARVRAGDPLARIDDDILRAEVAQAAADAALAREGWERQRRLWEQDSVGTELSYLEARFGAAQAGARLDLLETRLARTTVRAPIDGVLDARPVDVGTMVSPGVPVARIVDADTVRVAAGVPERFAAEVSPGVGAEVTFDAQPDRVLEGEIVFVGAVVDEASRTFPVEVEIARSDAAVKPGMVVNVRIRRREHDAAILVPQDAVLRTSDGYTVYVVEREDGRDVARARSVALGTSQGDRVLVRSGLAPSDQVIVVGQKLVAEGDPVEVVGSGLEAGR